MARTVSPMLALLLVLGLPGPAPAQPAGPAPQPAEPVARSAMPAAQLAVGDGAQAGVPGQAQLDQAVRLGAIATTGPLCGLRDARWGADLRSAELQAMGAPPVPATAAPEDRRRADVAGAALSYAEDEALEDFAEAPPDATCGPLARNPELAHADAMVTAWRRGERQPMW